MDKTDFIKFRVHPDDKAAFEAAAKARGTTLSHVLRSTVARWIKRHEKEADQ